MLKPANHYSCVSIRGERGGWMYAKAIILLNGKDIAAGLPSMLLGENILRRSQSYLRVTVSEEENKPVNC